MARPSADYTNRRFGRLLAERPAEVDLDGPSWHCRCDCGNQGVFPTKRLLRGLATCGECVGKPEEKPCAACGKMFAKTDQSASRWRQQATCSRTCAVAYRGDFAQSRSRTKVAMNRHWNTRKAVAANKAKATGATPVTREAEEAAIARFIAERGVTRAESVESEFIQARHEPARPQPMAGWR